VRRIRIEKTGRGCQFSIRREWANFRPIVGFGSTVRKSETLNQSGLNWKNMFRATRLERGNTPQVRSYQSTVREVTCWASISVDIEIGSICRLAPSPWLSLTCTGRYCRNWVIALI